MYSDDPRKLQSYWIEIHQIFKQSSQIIAAVKAPIIIAISQFVSECESDEKNE